MSDARPRAFDAETALRARLAADLRVALKARDAVAIPVLRSLIAALDNAGAVPTDGRYTPVFGLSGDVPRRDLSSTDIAGLLAAEAAERRAAIAAYESGGRQDAADRLRVELLIIARYQTLDP